MSIESPLVLLGLIGLAPIILVFLFEYRHTSVALQHLGQNWSEPGMRKVIFVKWLLGLVFFGLFYLLSILALSGWEWGEQPLPRDRSGLEVMVVVDVSRSMRVEDMRPHRLGRAVELVREVVAALPEARFGLVAFSGTAVKVVPLTEDRMALGNGLRHLGVLPMPVPGSAPAEGLDLALAGFPAASNRNQAMILVTDGEFTSYRYAAVLRHLRGRGVPLLVLGAGSPNGGQIPLENGASALDGNGEVVISKLNSGLLHQMAAEGGGWYLNIALADSVSQVAGTLQAYLKQSEQEGFRLVPVRRSPVFIASALFFLGLFVVTRALRWRMLW